MRLCGCSFPYESVARRRPPPRLTALVVTLLLLAVLLFPSVVPAGSALDAAAEAAPAGYMPMDDAEAAEVPPPPAWSRARHLIMVAGHAVHTGADHRSDVLHGEAEWFLEPYQHGQLETMLEHIQRGVTLAAADNDSLLLFSGGETRAAAGPVSEALSYWEVAEANGWFGWPAVRERAQLESQARDSLENLLFAVCRFHELTGAYPERVTVVSFAFKRRRFEELHRRALRLPRTSFSFEGVDPPDLPPTVPAAERKAAAALFEHDPYGCADPALRRKRATRNPFRRSVSYPRGCPELAPLIGRCSRDVYAGPLPWSAVPPTMATTVHDGEESRDVAKCRVVSRSCRKTCRGGVAGASRHVAEVSLQL